MCSGSSNPRDLTVSGPRLNPSVSPLNFLRGKAMKSLQWTLAIVAIAFVVPASAQLVDPSLISGVDRTAAAFTDGFKKQNASVVAEAFTVDGVMLSQSPSGALNYGTQAIAQRYEGLFKLGANNISITRSQLTQLGNDVAIALGEYQVTGQGQS